MNSDRPSRSLLTGMLVVLFISGCVSRRNPDLKTTEVQDLQNRIYELQKRNAEAQVEIQELREKGASGSNSGTSGPTSPAPAPGTAQNAEAQEEALIPGATVDLGEEGPTRSVQPLSPPSSTPASPAGSAVSPSPQPGVPAGVEPDKLYVDGYAQLNSGNFARAQQEFTEFLARSPESDLADDAQYWIGECLFSQKDYRRAILEFRRVIDQYPFGNRVPHAFLKVGLSYLALGDRNRAAESLETVVQAFPKSEVATVAQATLDEIKKSSPH